MSNIDEANLDRYLKQKEAGWEDPYASFQWKFSPDNRRALLAWLWQIADRWDLVHGTRFLGLQYFDAVHPRAEVTSQNVHCVALSCLLLAMKVREDCVHKPIVEVSQILGRPAAWCYHLELWLLHALCFRMNLYTAYDVIGPWKDDMHRAFLERGQVPSPPLPTRPIKRRACKSPSRLWR